MKALVAADSHLYKTPDGKYWCPSIYGYDFWSRYLDVFEEVIVVSRTKSATYEEVEGFLRVDGPNLSVSELPFMRGMKAYIKNYFKFIKSVKKAVKQGDCAILRLPSVSAFMVEKYFKKTGKPYSLEIVADPYDAYRKNKIAQIMYTKKLKKSALNANGVSYVTEFTLQKRYPSFAKKYGESEKKFETFYSTINLPESYFSKPRKYDKNKKKYTIVHTANSINSDTKGHDTLIRIIKELREMNYDVQAIFIGDGTKRPFYEKMVKNLRLDKYITFTGLIHSPKEVRNILLKGDIFVFPTKAEGLPRAVIEAMAVGLPVLSTPVNGIPELLKNEYLFDPLDVDGFSKKIIQLINNPEQLNKMSEENIKKAYEYVDYKLIKRRKEFYQKLKKIVDINNKNYSKITLL